MKASYFRRIELKLGLVSMVLCKCMRVFGPMIAHFQGQPGLHKKWINNNNNRGWPIC